MTEKANIKKEQQNSCSAIKLVDVSFSYGSDEVDSDSAKEKEKEKALDGVSFEIKQGEYIAILGHNGSGKSTMAKLISALEVPTEGDVYVLGNNTKEEATFSEIRKNTAIVFQNPDNQIVGATIEEDVAFGPENLGIPNPELRQRVDESLKRVGLYDLKEREAARLSGGQKQKLAIAGALAMHPRILILDEATSMLDPKARDEFLELVEKLTKENHLTLITITHDMNEAMRADRIYVLDTGRICLEGKPEDIFEDEKRITGLGLELPHHIKLANEIARSTGIAPKKECFADIQSTVKYIKDAVKTAGIKNVITESREHHQRNANILTAENLVYTYDNRKKPVLNGVNFTVEEGEMLALIGKSGCGKTTLISHLNAVMKATSGVVKVNTRDGKVLKTSNKKDIKHIRENVGLVFQYPEYQLFEETVYKDIEFGLKKQGKNEEERKQIIDNTVKLVGIKQKILNKSPFELSGGQKRRVAIAGVLAMEPRILVLDEPAAGLDPKSKNDMFMIIDNLKRHGVTIIIVSHNMDDVIRFSDRVLILSDGKTLEAKDTSISFADCDLLNSLGIKRPVLHSLLDMIIEPRDKETQQRIAGVRDYRDAVELILKEAATV